MKYQTPSTAPLTRASRLTLLNAKLDTLLGTITASDCYRTFKEARADFKRQKGMAREQWAQWASNASFPDRLHSLQLRINGVVRSSYTFKFVP